MQATGRRDSRAELALRRELHARGRRFFVDRSVEPLGRRRRVDIVFPRLRLAVFVDSCFYHRCPEHGTSPRTNGEWWQLKLDRNVARDRDTDARLRGAGWRVIRAWEHEPPRLIADRIETALDNDD